MILMFTIIEALSDADMNDIDLTDAAAMTSAFQANNPNPSGIIGGFFGRAAAEALLAQDGCIGLRYYFAVNPDPTQPQDITLVLTGVGMDGNDLYEGRLCEYSSPCPPTCSAGNPLNGG